MQFAVEATASPEKEQIKAVDALKDLENKIEAVDREISNLQKLKPNFWRWWAWWEVLVALRKEKEQLRDEKRQLRKEKEQLREKELLLLRIE